MERGLGNTLRFRLAFPANSPSFQVAGESHGMRFLFSGHQPQPTLAALSSFRVEASGDLKVINTVTVADLEESMIQIVLDHTQRCLVSASYRSGKVFSFKVSPDGQLSDPVSISSSPAMVPMRGGRPLPTRMAL